MGKRDSLDIVLEKLEPRPEEVIKLFSQLIAILNPEDAERVIKLQKKYADTFGITIYQ
jgi:hypothetical protein